MLAGCNSGGSQSGFSPSETSSQSVTQSGSTTRPSHRLTHYYLVTLPTLGGTAGFAYGVNDRGWIVGDANLPSNKVTHATIWINGRVSDLGTLGGPAVPSIGRSKVIGAKSRAFRRLSKRIRFVKSSAPI